MYPVPHAMPVVESLPQLFQITGTDVQVGCKQKTLSDGDVVRWRYTCDGGADIGGAA